jgi:hypothetical protein
LVPDGHVDTTAPVASGKSVVDDGDVKMLEDGRCEVDDNDGKERRPSANCDMDDDAPSCNDNDETTTKTVLPNLRSCYTCKVRFRNMHHFYDQLCPICAPYNYDKRHQTANMIGKVAVVTGSRVKIGYQVCLKLLRAGATVVATTRFPNNAVASFMREADFDVWRGRLNVYGLDLRDVTGLEAFAHYLKVKYGECGIDVLINNACQTVRRPGGYYAPLVVREGDLWRGADEAHRDVLRGCVDFERIRRRLVTDHADHDNCGGGNVQTAGSSARVLPLLGVDPTIPKVDEQLSPASGNSNDIITISRQNSTHYDYVPFESTGISHSAAMSQMAIVPEDVGVDKKVMPR